MSKTDSEVNGSAFDVSYPDGDVVQGADIDDFTKATKQAQKYRQDEEHLWPTKTEVGGDADAVIAAGRHRPGAGRCDAQTWDVLKVNTLFLQAKNNQGSVGDMNKIPKAGAIVFVKGTWSNQDNLTYTLWMMREDGKLVPLNKHLRGMIFKSGMMVHQQLISGFNNHDDGGVGVIFEDMDGVPEGAAIRDTMFVPYQNPDYPTDPNKYIWCLKVYNGDPEKFYGASNHTADSLEALCVDLENYDHHTASDGGVRVKISRNGLEFDYQDISGITPVFDGIPVKTHKHSGGDDGALLTLKSIDGSIGNRIAFYHDDTVVKSGFTISNTLWTQIGSISAANWNPSYLGTDALREIAFRADISGAFATAAGWEPYAFAFVRSDLGATVAADSLTDVEGIVTVTGVEYASNSLMGSGVMPFMTEAAGGIAHDSNIYIYIRNPLASHASASITFNYFARVWRR